MEKRSNLKTLRRFLPYFSKYKWILLTDLLMASLTTVCELVLPLMVREITDRATAQPMILTVEFVLKVGLLYILLRLIDSAAQFYMNSVGHIMGVYMETDMRRDLFAHLHKLSFSYYDNTKVGTIMSRITSDLFDITEFAHHCPEEFFIAGIKIVVGFAILGSFNLWLTVIIFAILPLMMVCTRFFNKRMRQAFKDSRVQTGELNAAVEDSLLGVRVVKSFAGEEMEQEKFRKGNALFAKIRRGAYFAMAGFHGTTRLFDGIMYIA
ncbi:MAG: ABC transporter ATP-binding protein, partial [Clostridia bacterium]|nr:ABC transporter ATP-binding protein [Clostridia bacterium]